MRDMIQKVTALITRADTNGSPELLAFRHPTAGVQLPAGTVEAGEDLAQAVLRETAEETGLTAVRLIRSLGVEARSLTDESLALLHDTTLRIGPTPEAKRLDYTFHRGNWLRVIDRVEDYAEVVYEETNLNYDPPALRIRFSGWLPNHLLATRLERHFFHLTPTASTSETWSQSADRHIFQLHWLPLVPKPTHLVAPQQVWLDAFYERLLASHAQMA